MRWYVLLMVALGAFATSGALKAESPASVGLGSKLFFDQRLSKDGSISCASCHRPELAFTDGRKLAIGIANQSGTRNTPSLINAALNTAQFWDGRRATLEQQALDPFLNSKEHGLGSAASLLSQLRRDPQYKVAFKRAFNVAPAQIRTNHVASAIAAFERTRLVDMDSPFDRFQYKQRGDGMPPAAIRGLRLFQGAARCASCHVIGDKQALFTDNKFHALGVGLERIERRLPELTSQLVHIMESGKSLDAAVLGDENLGELGRFAVTLSPFDIGKFRTPSLRNVALTAPYMHDGSVATLAEAVELEIYYRGVEMKRPLILTPDEKADLIQFLHTLTSEGVTKRKYQ